MKLLCMSLSTLDLIDTVLDMTHLKRTNFHLFDNIRDNDSEALYHLLDSEAFTKLGYMHEQTPPPRGVQRLEVDKVANIIPRILGHCGLNLRNKQ